MSPRTPTPAEALADAEAELLALETEVTDKRAALDRALLDANADGVRVLRESLGELETRIAFQRVLVAREVVKLIEAESDPYAGQDFHAEMEQARIEAQRAVQAQILARARLAEAVEATRLPRYWQQDRDERLQAARAKLVQAEAEARRV